MPDNDLLTSAQVAQELGMPEVTLRTWRRRGKGPKSLKVGIAVMYRRRDLDSWLQARDAKSA